MSHGRGADQEALLYRKLKGNWVRCLVCQRRCVIPEGKLGYCATRINRHGRLYTLIYGRVSTWRVAPAEIKPLFHFHPGSHYLSLGSVGCNFRCIGCQNWEIAHIELDLDIQEELEDITTFMSPREAFQLAQKQGCQGISWTYNEPTLWLEYVLEGAKLAKGKGMYTNLVTNGFMTPQALDLLGPCLDAYRVDVKGFSPEAYRQIAHVEDFSGILEVAKRAKDRWKMHLEVITNVVPQLNDDDQQLSAIASWICRELGSDTPWHVTRFTPHLHLSHLPATPVKSLERARQLGLEVGLHYVYLGNVPGHPGENTYCPSCQRLLIERRDYQILSYAIEDGRCPQCGQEIPIVENISGSFR
jgi:pyruvate formate lyase activating enzyme